MTIPFAFRLHFWLLLMLILFSPLLQAQTPPQTPSLTGIIEKITSVQTLNLASGELMGNTVLSLSSLPPKSMRVYFPSNRILDQVSLGGRPLRFSHQSGLLTVFMEGLTASPNQPQSLNLAYRSKQESVQGPSPLFELESYRLNYSLQTTSGVFQAQSFFQVKGRKNGPQNTGKGLPTLPPPRTISLALNRVFTVETVQSGGRALAFQHRQGQLRIQLPGPLMPGRSYSLEIRYSGKLPAGNKYQIWDTPFGGGPYFYPAHPLKPGAY